MLKTISLFILGAFLVIIILPNMLCYFQARSKTTDVGNAPKSGIAIVFGAGLWRDGTPTPVLRDRVETAAELYFAGKVNILLMSGDNRFLSYNEPGAMKQYAINLGIPEAAIVLDFAGRRTYDTCYRAKHIFGVDRAVLVTQAFHLPRALYLCRQFGIEATGVPANHRKYSFHLRLFWRLREMFATPVAIWEANITKPLPILGDPEPISIPDSSRE